MSGIRLGVALWSQQTSWQDILDAARLVDRLGYDTLFTDDHLLADTGRPDQPKFEAWVSAGAWAAVTEQVRIGHWVVANTFRNPGLVAKMAVTLDHASGGRAILGMGAGWFGREHRAFGIDFGRGTGERLDWLDESVGLLRALLAGDTVSHAGRHYTVQELAMYPPPLQRRLPILVGGAGERKTLRTVARYADMWNVIEHPLDDLRRKLDVLGAHCDVVGRDPREIELTLSPSALMIRDDPREARRAFQAALDRNQVEFSTYAAMYRLVDADAWFGPPQMIAERMLAYVELGFRHFIFHVPSPYDRETLVRLAGEVRSLLVQ